uniref:Uncharacterized protein n=1 Tax=Junco hyemalis TaxID=40217 RepID=A0A8C5NNS9_JUNHY
MRGGRSHPERLSREAVESLYSEILKTQLDTLLKQKIIDIDHLLREHQTKIEQLCEVYQRLQAHLEFQ